MIDGEIFSREPQSSGCGDAFWGFDLRANIWRMEGLTVVLRACRDILDVWLLMIQIPRGFYISSYISS